MTDRFRQSITGPGALGGKPRRFTGWRRGRILATRMLASALCIGVFVATHPTDLHGMKDLLMALVGLYLVLVSIKGRIWCMLYIGGKKDRTLVVDGPYSRSRNPLYYYSTLGVVGIAAASGMLTAVAGLFLVVVAGNYIVIRREEKKLRLLHGDSFTDYCSRVPRFWPRWKLFQEAERHSFEPKLFHKTFWDAAGFLAGWLVVATAHLLHSIESLPRWVRFM